MKLWNKLKNVIHGNKTNKDAKQVEPTKNIRDTIEKYEIKYPETVESLEDKITRIYMEMKEATSINEIATCIANLDWYKQELNYLKRIQANNKSDKSENIK